jgi:hypothetical protein
MGEVLLYNLNYKSFIDFSEDILGPAVSRAGKMENLEYCFLCT